MEKKQIFTLLAIFGAFTGLILLTSLLSGGSEKQVTGGSRFYARPGTMRSGTRALALRKSSPATQTRSPDSVSAKPGALPTWGGASDHKAARTYEETPPKGPSPGEKVVEEALNALIPARGLEKIQAYCAAHPHAAAASALYSTMGTLYLQVDPPNIEEAFLAFDVAIDSAQTAGERHQAVYAAAAVLQANAEPQAAIKTIEEALRTGDPVTLAALRGRLLLGKLYEDSGRKEAAETAYKNVADECLAISEMLGEEALNIYRQACLKLARFYRKDGRPYKADTVTRSMKFRLEH